MALALAGLAVTPPVSSTQNSRMYLISGPQNSRPRRP